MVNKVRPAGRNFSPRDHARRRIRRTRPKCERRDPGRGELNVCRAAGLLSSPRNWQAPRIFQFRLRTCRRNHALHTAQILSNSLRNWPASPTSTDFGPTPNRRAQIEFPRPGPPSSLICCRRHPEARIQIPAGRTSPNRVMTAAVETPVIAEGIKLPESCRTVARREVASNIHMSCPAIVGQLRAPTFGQLWPSWDSCWPRLAIRWPNSTNTSGDSSSIGRF